MAARETPPSTDLIIDPQILAEARLYVSPSGDNAAMLQNMIGAVLGGQSPQEVCPETELSPAAEYFFRGATQAEIALARTVLSQWELYGDIPAFTALVSKPLDKSQKRQFAAGIDCVTTRYGEASADILLRRLNGELKKQLAFDYQLPTETIKSRLRRARPLFEAKLDNPTTVYALLEPTFPRQRQHFTYHLQNYIDSLNTDVTDLGRYISMADLQVVGHMLAGRGLDAEAMSKMLRYLNTVQIKYGVSSEEAIQGKSILLCRFEPPEVKALQGLRIHGRARTLRGQQEVYEASDEATRLIYEVLAMPAEAYLSKEVQMALAKDIELMVYAEKKREELFIGRPAGEQSKEEKEMLLDLDTIITTGQVAMRTLLNTHKQLVCHHVHRLIPGKRILYEDLVVAGMRGMLRAIRKYDYQHPSTKRLTNYAIPWIRKYIWQYIFKHDWKVSSDTGTEIVRVLTSKSRLKVEHGVAGDSREVGSADIAADLNMTTAEVDQLLLLYNRARSDSPARGEDAGQRLRANQSTPVRVRFAPAVRKAFGKVLTDPLALQVLELHIGADVGITEIAGIVSLTDNEVSKLITTAFAELNDHFSKTQLFALLQGHTADTSYDDMLDV